MCRYLDPAVVQRGLQDVVRPGVAVDAPHTGDEALLVEKLEGVGLYGLTMRCDVWWQHEVNPFEEAPEIAARVTLYGRRNRAA